MYSLTDHSGYACIEYKMVKILDTIKAYLVLSAVYIRYCYSLLPPIPEVGRRGLLCSHGIIMCMRLYLKPRDQSLPFGENIQIRDFFLESGGWSGRDVYRDLVEHPYMLWRLCGQTREMFNIACDEIHDRLNYHNLDRKMILSFKPLRTVLLTLLGFLLRQYPTYAVLSIYFDISSSTVCLVVHQTWPKLWHVCIPKIRRPSRRRWQRMRGGWPKVPNVVGVIDGTPHEVCWHFPWSIHTI